MVINIKENKKFDIRRTAVLLINRLIYKYRTEYDLESIYFREPIDGIKFYKRFPHFSEKDYVSDWYSIRIKGTTLLKVLKCLKERDFNAYVRTSNGSTVLLKFKKNDKEKL